MITNSSIIPTRKALALLLTSTILLAAGINLFISPHHLAFGGITGITVIMKSLTGIPVFMSNFILSISVILMGWKELGHGFMVKTIIPTVTLPFFLCLTDPLSNFTPDLYTSAFLGAVCVGTGISLSILAGGSTAGPDTIGLVLKKRFGIPVTLTMVVIDTAVILCGYRIYGPKTAACSVIVSFIMNITVKITGNLLSKKIDFRYQDKFNKGIKTTI